MHLPQLLQQHDYRFLCTALLQADACSCFSASVVAAYELAASLRSEFRRRAATACDALRGALSAPSVMQLKRLEREIQSALSLLDNGSALLDHCAVELRALVARAQVH